MIPVFERGKTFRALDRTATVVGFAVITAGNMKNTTFWDLSPFIPIEVPDFSEKHTASIFRAEE
jgi:hypothetical protein